MAIKAGLDSDPLILNWRYCPGAEYEVEREGDEERSATTWKTDESDVAGETRESGAGVQVVVVAEAEAATEMRREKGEMEASGRLEKCRDGRNGLEEKVQVAI